MVDGRGLSSRRGLVRPDGVRFQGFRTSVGSSSSRATERTPITRPTRAASSATSETPDDPSRGSPARKAHWSGQGSKLVPARHRLGDEETPHPPRDARLDRRVEEEPDMPTVARSRPFDSDREIEQPTGLDEGGDVFLPGRLVKVDSEKLTGLVREQRIYPDYVSALKVIANHTVVDRNECLIGTEIGRASCRERV